MRRGTIEIMGRILEVSVPGANKTQVAFRANLNFVRARRYIKFLENKGLLIKLDGNPGIYKTTDRGKKYLQNYKKLVENLKQRSTHSSSFQR
jgi:predicted transcriptional regulator